MHRYQGECLREQLWWWVDARADGVVVCFLSSLYFLIVFSFAFRSTAVVVWYWDGRGWYDYGTLGAAIKLQIRSALRILSRFKLRPIRCWGLRSIISGGIMLRLIWILFPASMDCWRMRWCLMDIWEAIARVFCQCLVLHARRPWRCWFRRRIAIIKYCFRKAWCQMIWERM